MKRFKTVLFIAFLSTSLFAQTDKMREQAITFVDKLNTEIVSENSTLALSEKQKTEIGELIAQRMQAYTDLNKTEKDKEKLIEAQKEVVKPYNKKIFGEIITKEQRLALDNARKKSKDNANKMLKKE